MCKYYFHRTGAVCYCGQMVDRALLYIPGTDKRLIEQTSCRSLTSSDGRLDKRTSRDDTPTPNQRHCSSSSNWYPRYGDCVQPLAYRPSLASIAAAIRRPAIAIVSGLSDLCTIWRRSSGYMNHLWASLGQLRASWSRTCRELSFH